MKTDKRIEVLNKLKDYYISTELICKKCGHHKYDHWWNGGGYESASGWDRCHLCDCIYDEDNIEEMEFINEERKLFLESVINTEIQKAVEKAVSGFVEFKNDYEKEWHKTTQERGFGSGWIISKKSDEELSMEYLQTLDKGDGE